MGVALALCAAPAGAVTIGSNQGYINFTNPGAATVDVLDAAGNIVATPTGQEVLTFLGLQVGTGVTWSADYDPTFLTGVGEEHIFPSLYPDGGTVPNPGGLNNFMITAGNLAFTMANDVDFPAFPDLMFLDGVFAGLSFYANFDIVADAAGAWAIVASDAGVPTEYEFMIYDGADTTANGFVVEVGAADAGDPLARGTVVPEPGTMLLLGSGLIGLASRGRRKKQQ
jgi:hypothetical protein